MEWGLSNTTSEVQENKNRIMRSNLFDDSNQQNQIQVAQQRINQNHQQNFHNINNNRLIDNIEASTFTKGNMKLLIQAPQASFTGIVHQAQVPALSTFPEISIPQQVHESVSFDLKPRTPVRTNHRKLAFRPSNGMRLLRDSLANDLSQFTQKIQQLSQEEPLKIMNAEFRREKVDNNMNQPSETFMEENVFSKSRKKSPSPKNNQITKPEDVSSNTKSIVRRNRGKLTNKFNELAVSGESSRSINDTTRTSNTLRASQNLDDAIGFQTVSEFILPDGTTYIDT